MFPQKLDVKDVLSLNGHLMSLANELFKEGKWSHTVTNQTLDFVEPLNGKYVCGCITFIKIQLENGTFHEDIGYCYAEGATKGLSIYHARIGSVNEAFKKVLQCFGTIAKIRIQELTEKCQSTCKQNSELSLNNIDIEKPFAQPIPHPIDNSIEQSRKPEIVFKSKSPNNKNKAAGTNEKFDIDLLHDINQGIPGLSTVKVQNQIEQNGHPAKSLSSPKPRGNVLNELQLQEIPQHNTNTHHQKEEALTEEEVLRMERKRKQLRKQAEYKRLMKEREEKQMSNDKKSYPKY